MGTNGAFFSNCVGSNGTFFPFSHVSGRYRCNSVANIFRNNLPQTTKCYGAFTLPDTETDTDTDNLTQNPMWPVSASVSVQCEHFHRILYNMGNNTITKFCFISIKQQNLFFFADWGMREYRTVDWVTPRYKWRISEFQKIQKTSLIMTCTKWIQTKWTRMLDSPNSKILQTLQWRTHDVLWEGALAGRSENSAFCQISEILHGNLKKHWIHGMGRHITANAVCHI